MTRAASSSAVFAVSVCLLGLNGKDRAPFLSKTMTTTQTFSAAVERDPKKGWSIAVLRCVDSRDVNRNLEARIAVESDHGGAHVRFLLFHHVNPAQDANGNEAQSDFDQLRISQKGKE